MARTKISEFSATANSNTDINSINIAEGCAPSNINDAIRELMAELKDFQAGTKGDSFNGPVGTTTAAAGAFTTLSSTGNTTLGDAVGDTVTINGTATFSNANPTLSAGTANGVLYLNGSKVATSGSALTFDGTNFATTGSGTVKNLLLTGGTLPSAGNPSIALRSSDNVVYHQSGSANNIVLLDSSQNTMYSVASTAHIFAISNSEQMRLTSTGLGIGLGGSSPGNRLHVQGSGDVARFTNGSNSAYFALDSAGFTLFTGAGQTGNGLYAKASDNSLQLWTNSSAKVYLDSSGNLTVPAMYSTTVTTPRNVFIDSTGKMGGISSTRASKTNISQLDTASWIYELNPVTFNYLKKDEEGEYLEEFEEEQQFGLIAEEVELVKPELCIYTDDKVSGIHYDRMIAPLIKAIQELKASNDALTARIAQLEAK